ncbi:MAG: hypothetical protein IJM76_05870 [Lachnospiraceae bacterium]|nr:hypothetical protein [Lachnospiraceae bacterium]
MGKFDTIIEQIRKRLSDRESSRIDADTADEKGRWITTEKGNHVHINESGTLDKGNPYVVSAMKGYTIKHGSVDPYSKSKRKSNEAVFGYKNEFGEFEEVGSYKRRHEQPYDKSVKSGNNNIAAGAKQKSSVMGTKTTETKTGVKYPKLKDGAVYMKTIDEAEKTSMEDEENGWYPKGTYDKVISSLTEKDVVYQEDEKGNTVASIPGLAAKVDNAIKGSERMRKVFEDALADSKIITEDMLAAAKKSGAYLVGLENSCKGASHLEDKAERKLEKYRAETGDKNATVDDVAENGLGDLVRFTAMAPNERFVDAVIGVEESLKEKGYTIAGRENKFLKKDGTVNNDGTYRAVHVTAISPSGRTIEVQVHSPESEEVKIANTPDYKKQRKLDKTPRDQWTDEMKEEEKRLIAVQVERWHKGYKNPPGIEKLKSFGD